MQAEVMQGDEAVAALAEGVTELAKAAEEFRESEAAALLTTKAADLANEARGVMKGEAARNLIASAEQQAVSALGEDAVSAVKDTIADLSEIDAASYLPPLQVSEAVKQQASSKASKVWDALCKDGKTRELASRIAENVSLTSDSERLAALKGAVSETLAGPEDAMSRVAAQARKLMDAGMSDLEELQNDSKQVWDEINGRQELWDFLDKGRSTFTQVRLEPGQSLMQNSMVKQVYSEGEMLLGQLASNQQVKALLEKGRAVLWRLWEQVLAELGIAGDVEDFMATGAELWEQLDLTVVSSALSTMLQGVLELALSVIPEIPIPRLLGVYSSPVGDVSYQLTGMQFSSFTFLPENFSLELGTKLSLSLRDISANINNFSWHFAKNSFPMMTGAGTGSVRTSNASVSLEYQITYQHGRVCLRIDRQEVVLNDFSVTVSDTGNSWLYNMILAVLNTKLRHMLESQLLLAALSQLKSLASMVDQISKGFLTIALAPHLRHAAAEAEEAADNRPEIVQVSLSLLRAFEPKIDVSSQVLAVDGLTIGLLMSCTQSPKVLLYDDGSKIPSWFVQLAQLFAHEPLAFGYVPCTHPELLAEFKLEPGCAPMLWIADPDTGFQHTARVDLEFEPIARFLQHFCARPGSLMHASEASLRWSVGWQPIGTATALLFVADDHTPEWFTAMAAQMLAQRKHHPRNRLDFVVMHGASEAILNKYKLPELPGLVVLPGPGQRPRARICPATDPAEVELVLARFVFNTQEIVTVTGHNVDLFLHRNPSTLKCLLFTSHRQTPTLYKNLWKRFGGSGQIAFGIVFSPEDEVMAKFGIVDAPGPMIPPVLLVFQAMAYQTYRGPLNETAIGEFFKDMSMSSKK
eukprot:TRINITY_DN20220_c0_g1_i2.p1 TRINITY_DN20220_c0_g1~~TRINITY_DN20220_c0_g1_i2.p1  ORF type:complete len:865 (+),score=228.79 TRINITY_DN20220_c0_g1_i2:207-2801(+)